MNRRAKYKHKLGAAHISAKAHVALLYTAVLSELTAGEREVYGLIGDGWVTHEDIMAAHPQLSANYCQVMLRTLCEYGLLVRDKDETPWVGCRFKRG